VRNRCLEECPSLLFELLPGGVVVKRHYHCGNIHGGEGKSFDVNLKNGKWGDWADPDGPRGGDIISLYAAVRGLEYKAALRELSEKYGIKIPQKTKSDWRCVLPVPEEAFSRENGIPTLPGALIPPEKQVNGVWPYSDAQGNLLCFRVRLESAKGKEFWTITYRRDSFTGKCAWRFQAPPQPWTLYNLGALSSSPQKILVVEGEKVADAATRLLPGWAVITWPGGSNNVDSCDWTPLLTDLRDVPITLWPDNDKPGQQAMSRVAEILGRPVEIVDVDPRWPEKYDLADLERDSWTTAQTEEWIFGHGKRTVPEKAEPKPVVVLHGPISRQVNAILDSILAMKDPPLFYLGTDIIRMVTSSFGRPEKETVGPRDLSSWAALHLDLRTFAKNGVEKETTIGDYLAAALHQAAQTKLEKLRFLSRFPVFSPDGKLLANSGYHPEIRAYLTVPDTFPGPAPIDEALGELDDWLVDFPFQTQADRANCLAFALTPILRLMIGGPVPMVRFEAPVAGTGKTLLVDTISNALTEKSEATPLSESVEEIRKVVMSALRDLPPIVHFDNANKILGPALAGVITSRWWGDRMLGVMDRKSYPVQCAWAVTINNAQLNREFLRRTVRVRLDSNLPHPENRTEFKHPNIIDYTLTNRGRILGALVGVCSYGLQNRRKDPSRRVLGSFNAWSLLLGEILEACGFSGFLETTQQDQEQACNPADDAFENFIKRWSEKYGSSPVYTKELTELAAEIHDFPTFSPGGISERSTGWMLRSRRGQMFEDGKIDGPHHSRNGNYWILQKSGISEKSEKTEDEKAQKELF
jgi:hypothetical protein